MKRKLIVTLVASALELYAASAGAASCLIANNEPTASGATKVYAGPLNPLNGFPEYVSDSNGKGFVRCLDAALCAFDAPVLTDAFSVQIGSGGEAFYWGATALATNPNTVTFADGKTGTASLKFEAAAETAFLQAGPNGEPINGSQFPFLRLRITFDAPADGTYTLRHPYGTEVFEVNGASGNRNFVTSFDLGLSAGQYTTGKVGPFLISNSAPAGYAGNLVADSVTGSPCDFNEVELTGYNSGGPIDFGGGLLSLGTTDFTVQGKNFTGVTQTPLTSDRLTYSRTALGGQIDGAATSSNSATVDLGNGPSTVTGTTALIRPTLRLAKSEFAPSPTASTHGDSVALAAGTALPSVLTFTGKSTTTLDTNLHSDLVDFVDITSAEFDPATNRLTVTANSGDQVTPPTLTLRGFGPFAAGTSSLSLTTAAPPAVVYVDSSAHGSASAQVRVIAAAVPAAPDNLTFGSATARTLTVSFTDHATTESGFRVYAVPVTGGATVEQTFPANPSSTNHITTVTVAGLQVATQYKVRVVAFNNAGASDPTNVIDAQTLALPSAPTLVVPKLAPRGTALTTAGANIRAINVTFNDTATDETSYLIERAVSTAPTAWTTAGTLPVTAPSTTGSLTFVDAPAAQLNTGTTYLYRVTAVRGADSSVAVTGPGNSVTTPNVVATGNAPLAPTFGAITLNSLVVNFLDRSPNETSFQVFRAPVTGTGVGVTGAFAAVSDALPAGTGTSTASTAAQTFTDTTAPNNARFKYRVEAQNWAGVTTSPASATVNSAVALTTPTNLAANPGTAAGSMAVTWSDTNTETGYKVEYSTDGAVFTQAVTQRAANATSSGTFTVATTAEATYTFKVTALNAAESTSATITLPGLIAPTALSVPAGTGNTDISWTDNSGVETSYVLERCAGNAIACAALNAPWQNVAMTRLTNNQTGTGNRTARITGVTATSTYRLSARWGNASSGYAKFTR